LKEDEMIDYKGMFLTRLILVLISIILMSPPVYADDFQEGIVSLKQKDFKTALEKLLPLAKKGHAEAQYVIGFIYYLGHETTINYEKAFKWYMKSAEQGNKGAQTSLGVMYYHGDGVTKSFSEALKWYKLSAAQGDLRGQIKLGMMYKSGEGINKDPKEAFKWLNLAAEQGDSDAQIVLGDMYMKGEGVTKNYIQALKWFYIAGLYKNERALPLRDILLKELRPKQVSEAQILIKEWIDRHR
jgi:uncharacterized protein